MADLEDPELSSSHQYNNSITIYSSILSENKLMSSRTPLQQIRIKEGEKNSVMDGKGREWSNQDTHL